MSDEYNIGRPYGGTGWLLSNQLNLKAKVKFDSDRFSRLKIRNLTIIGVYMHYNQNNNDSLIAQENLISQILTIIEETELGKNNSKIIIIGDDLTRNSNFDQTLKTLIEKENLICLDLLHTQKIDYTYKMRSTLPIIAKSSDHRALRLKLKMPENIRCKNKVKKKKNWRINWQDKMLQEEYKEVVTKNLNKLNLTELIGTNKDNVKNLMSKMLNELNSTLMFS
jgi:hypothetical protein